MASPILVQRRDPPKRPTLAGEIPVSAQLLAMERGPFENQGQRSPRQASAKDREALDADLGLELGGPSVHGGITGRG